MYNRIPQQVKDMFSRSGVTKNVIVRLYYPDGTYTQIDNDELYKESVKFSESLCTRETPKWGLCEGATLSFTCRYIGDLRGMTIRAFICIAESGLSQYELPYGVFVVDKCDIDIDKTQCKVTAYSPMLSLDNSNPVSALQRSLRYLDQHICTFHIMNAFVAEHWEYFDNSNWTYTHKNAGEYAPLTPGTLYYESSRWTYNGNDYTFKIINPSWYGLGTDPSTGGAYTDDMPNANEIWFYDEITPVQSSVTEVTNGINSYGCPTAIKEDIFAHVFNDTPYAAFWSYDEDAQGMDRTDYVAIPRGSYTNNCIIMGHDGSGGYPAYNVYKQLEYQICRKGVSDTVVQSNTIPIFNDLGVYSVTTGFTDLTIKIKPTEYADETTTFYTYEDFFAELDSIKLLESYCELLGKFGGLDRDGWFKLYDICPNEHDMVYPANDIYPDQDLYPDDVDSTMIIRPGQIISASYDENAFRYGGITCRYTNTYNNDAFYSKIVDPTLPIYDVSDNEIIKGSTRSKAQIKTLLATLQAEVLNFSYVSGKVDMQGLPYIECGDTLYIQGRNFAFTLVVMDRDLSGIQVLRDKIVAK